MGMLNTAAIEFHKRYLRHQVAIFVNREQLIDLVGRSKAKTLAIFQQSSCAILLFAISVETKLRAGMLVVKVMALLFISFLKEVTLIHVLYPTFDCAQRTNNFFSRHGINMATFCPIIYRAWYGILLNK